MIKRSFSNEMKSIWSQNKIDDELPCITPRFEYDYDKCELLKQFHRVIRDLPIQVKNYLMAALVDPMFTHMRQTSGEPENVPLTMKLQYLYQCVDLCREEQLPFVVAAISIITGLSPKIILEHLMLEMDPLSEAIVQTVHLHASRNSPEPIFTFSGRIEAAELGENIPTSYLWTSPGNPYNDLDLPEWIFDEKPVTSNGELNEFQKQVFTQLEMNNKYTPQENFLLMPIPIRKDLKSPFFYSPDLSDGFNPDHGLPPVPCFNEIDDQRPPPILWIASLQLPDSIDPTCEGCKCLHGDCNKCHQITFEDGKQTMTYTDEGLIDLSQINNSRPLVIECNDQCECKTVNCRNRVVQNRSNIQLMVVRSPTKSGWGVRTMQFIPRGSFVCEYLGKVITDPLLAEAMGREYDTHLESYLFDLDAYGIPDNEMLTVDPSRVGNVSKYINHSCDPNLIQISIGTVKSHLFHRITFFAARNIYPNEELGFHYNYEFDHDASRFIECNCGCTNCRTRLR